MCNLECLPVDKKYPLDTNTYCCAIRCHMGKALVRCVAFRTHPVHIPPFIGQLVLQPQLQLLVVGCGMHQTRFLTISGEGWLVKKAEEIDLSATNCVLTGVNML